MCFRLRVFGKRGSFYPHGYDQRRRDDLIISDVVDLYEIRPTLYLYTIGDREASTSLGRGRVVILGKGYLYHGLLS